jgi:hypothetical protein
MIFDQYIKLFSMDWIEPWLVEALAIMVGSFILILVVCKVMDFLNRESS